MSVLAECLLPAGDLRNVWRLSGASQAGRAPGPSAASIVSVTRPLLGWGRDALILREILIDEIQETHEDGNRLTLSGHIVAAKRCCRRITWKELPFGRRYVAILPDRTIIPNERAGASAHDFDGLVLPVECLKTGEPLN
jgi:hypothetical protein